MLSAHLFLLPSYPEMEVLCVFRIDDSAITRNIRRKDFHPPGRVFRVPHAGFLLLSIYKNLKRGGENVDRSYFLW